MKNVTHARSDTRTSLFRKAAGGLASIAVATLLAGTAQAQEKIDLTIASSHPSTLPWIGLMQKFFEPEVNKRLAAAGNEYQIEWQRGYGGTLYKANATLTSIGDGITDIGWVFSSIEGSRLPLSQVGNYTPAVTGNPEIVMEVVNEMNDTMPALQKEWDKNNVVFLTSTAMDTLHLFTNFPVTKVSDLDGKKIGGAGAIGSVVAGAGATPINAPAPEMYNNVATGLMEGTVTITSVVLGTKLYEVTPYITKVDLGTFSAGALAFNKDRWEELPQQVRDVIREVARDYSRTFGKVTNERTEGWFDLIQKQNPDAVVTTLSDEERTKWVQNMPNVAAEWVEATSAAGLPAQEVLSAYMDGLRAKGVKPIRDWDK